MTPEQEAALSIAHRLAEAGVPIFLARPARTEQGKWDPAGGSGGSGYWLPKGWENTTANPRYLEAWEPGMAVCAVMGHILDLVDLDPRNGGDPTSLNGSMPAVYGVASTPSGGYHGFVKALGVRSRDAVLPGIDIKAGDLEGRGRGFAFIAPTVKLSKATGAIGEYRWVEIPDLNPDKLAADASGGKLAEIVRRAHGSRNTERAEPDNTEARDWMIAEIIPRGSRYPWLRSYAGWLREKNVPLSEALVLMRTRWEACEQPPDYLMPWEDAEDLLLDIYGRYTAGEPVGQPTTIIDREQAAAAETVDKYDDLYLPRSALANLPRGEPLIDGVIDRHSLFVIAGRDQSYKSFLALDWLCCLATGKPWLGKHVEQCRVLYVVGEGAWGLDGRITAWETAYGKQVEDEWFTVRRAPVNLFKHSEALADMAARIRDEHYGVVIFDTLQRMSSGADQNAAKDAGVIISTLDQLRHLTHNGAVGVVAHTDKGDNDTRGSSAFEDDADIVWRMRRDEDEQAVTATLAKRKDGPDGEYHRLRPEPVKGTESLILVLASGLLMGASLKHPARTEDVLRVLSMTIHAETGASISAVSEILGLKGKGTVHNAMNWLVDRGYVRFEDRGRKSNYKITSSGSSMLKEMEESYG